MNHLPDISRSEEQARLNTWLGKILKLASLRYHTSDGRRAEVNFHGCYASGWYDAILLLTT
jgi:hypothetical protein